MKITVEIEKGESARRAATVARVVTELPDGALITPDVIGEIVGSVLAQLAVTIKYGDGVPADEVVRRRLN